MRVIIGTLVVLLALLQYKLWFAPDSISTAMHLKTEVAQLQLQNAQWQNKNAVLAADVQDLKHGNEAIEERARTELGMVKPDEVYYQIVQ